MEKIKILCFTNNDGLSRLQIEILKDLKKKYTFLDVLEIQPQEGDLLKKYNISEYPTVVIEGNSSNKKFSGLTQSIFIERAINELINNTKI